MPRDHRIVPEQQPLTAVQTVVIVLCCVALLRLGPPPPISGIDGQRRNLSIASAGELEFRVK